MKKKVILSKIKELWEYLTYSDIKCPCGYSIHYMDGYPLHVYNNGSAMKLCNYYNKGDKRNNGI